MSAPGRVEQFVYPVWFVQGGTAGVIVGYAPDFMTSTTAESLAVVDAHLRARLSARMRIRVDAGFEARPGEWFDTRGEISEEEPLVDSVPLFMKGSTSARGMYLVAAGLDSAAPRVPAAMVTLGATLPSWLEHPPASEGEWWYGVGISTAYAREYVSWDAAERHARQTLAFNAGARLRSMMAGTEEQEMSVMEVSTAVEMEAVSVVSRWRDAGNCYVLVRGRILAVRGR
jgi:hypothetical protein